MPASIQDLPELVIKVEHDIKKHPDRFAEPIAWWNKNFTRSLYRSRLARELRERRQAGERLEKSRASWRVQNRGRWIFLARVRDAMDTFPHDERDWRRLSACDAARILLVTVLITRPDFNMAKIGLLDSIEWRDGQLLAGEVFGREWVETGCFPNWNDKTGNNGRWMRLAALAALIVYPEGIGAEPGTVNSSTHAEPPAVSEQEAQVPEPSEGWLTPMAAMAMLRLGDVTDPERRRFFDKLRKLLPSSDRKKVGRVERVRLGAWESMCKILRSQSEWTDDWSRAVDSLTETELRKAAERQRKMGS